MNCLPVNLKTEFGNRYKIEKDPACSVTGQSREERDWLFTIPCRAGGPGSHIYSHGDRSGENALGYSHDGRGPMRTRLLGIPGVSLHADFQDGYVLTFPLGAFKKVARVVKPRTRRRLTKEQKKEFAERLRQWRFPANKKPLQTTESTIPLPGNLIPSDDDQTEGKTFYQA